MTITSFCRTFTSKYDSEKQTDKKHEQSKSYIFNSIIVFNSYDAIM